jgi:8-oxo-dGTP pyrophosphatase MutT (NUDIX family)
MTKKISEGPVIFVSGILEKMEGNVKKIFLQTRWKPETSGTYSGLLEIPGGRINNFENVFDAIQREVWEECGLKIISCRNAFQEELYKISQIEQSMVFQPFICQQVLANDNGRPWFGFVFICQVEGEPKMQKGETKDPRWVSLKELEKLLNEQPEKIFPHQFQALKYYVESVKRS